MFVGKKYKKSTKRKSLKRKSIKRKSTKRKSTKRKSIKRKSTKRKSTKRKSTKRKSTKRKSTKRTYGGMENYAQLEASAWAEELEAAAREEQEMTSIKEYKEDFKLELDKTNINLLKNNTIVCVFGNNSLDSIYRELNIVNYKAIYAIGDEEPKETYQKIGSFNLNDIKQYYLNYFNNNDFWNSVVKHKEYDTDFLNNISIDVYIVDTNPNLFYVTSTNSPQLDTDKHWMNGIGPKRFVGQCLWYMNIQKNNYPYFIGIDDTTCLLSSINIESDESIVRLSHENKILWEDGIKLFYNFVINNNFNNMDDFIFGFAKATESYFASTNNSTSVSYSIYKFICMSGNVLNNVWYDPYLIQFKEDVDFLYRCKIHEIQGYKMPNTIVCKLDEDKKCNNNMLPSSQIVLWNNTAEYYYNMFYRLIYLDHNKYFGYYSGELYPSCLIPIFNNLQPSFGYSAQEISDKFEQQEFTFNGQITFINQNDEKTTVSEITVSPSYAFVYQYPNNKLRCGFKRYDTAAFQILTSFGEHLIVKYETFQNAILELTGGIPKDTYSISTFGSSKRSRRQTKMYNPDESRNKLKPKPKQTVKSRKNKSQERRRKEVSQSQKNKRDKFKSERRMLPNQWTCNNCTYINKWSNNKCEMCANPRPKQWNCNTCTFLNNWSNNKCEICGSFRP